MWELEGDEGAVLHSYLRCLCHAVPELWVSCGKADAALMGLSGFPNAETLNLTMSYVDVGLIGHRVQTRKGPV